MKGGLGHAMALAAVVAIGLLVDELLAQQPFAPEERVLRAAGAALGVLLLGSWLAGKVVGTFGLPKISGYLVFGLLAGPSLLGVVDKDELGVLKIVNELAIALIALTAGGEIRLAALRGRLKAILILSAAIPFGILVSVSGAVALAPGFFGLGGVAAGTETLVLAVLIGTLATANSPAALVAVMTELRAAGPMCRISLSVTVLKDIVLIALFGVVMAIAAGVFGDAAGDHGGNGLARYLLWHLGGSVLAGVVVGAALAAYLRWVRAHLPIFIVLAGFVIAIGAAQLALEPLLTALVAGFLMRNLWEADAEELFHTIEELSLPVYCVFFSVAGAKLDLAALGGVWVAVLALATARAAATWGVIRVSAAWTKIEPAAQKQLWTAFLPQAGVALALLTIAADELGGQPFADAFFNLVLMAIALHEIAGPVLLKLGIVAAGEAGKAQKTPHE